MKTLIILVGLPRSGKSTWSRKQNYPIVNRDSIRLAHHGQAFLPECEDYITHLENTMVDALFLAGHNTIIIDATHTNLWSRKRWRTRMKGKGVRITYKMFDTDKETCKQRAIETDQEYLLPIIDRMSNKFEPLTLEELSMVID